MLETLPEEAWDTPRPDGFLPGRFTYTDGEIALELLDIGGLSYRNFVADCHTLGTTYTARLIDHEGVHHAIKAALSHDFEFFD